MGLRDIFKMSAKQTNNEVKEKHITEDDRKVALETLSAILHALHVKRFQDVSLYVDKSEVDNIEEFLSEYVKGTLELNDYNSIDEYGVACSFRPSYEYSQISIDEYNDKTGFLLDYEMTSGGELVDLVLQLKFIYTNNGLQRIFHNIDPQ